MVSNSSNKGGKATHYWQQYFTLALFAWLFLGKKITLTQGLGGVLILGATYFADFEGKRMVNSFCSKRLVNG